MPGYHNNRLSYCLEGVWAVYVLGVGLIFCLFSGSLLGVVLVHHRLLGVSTIYTLLWFGAVLTGLAQVWGLLSYTIIGLEAIALFRAASHRWLILLTILLIQTCETSRMLLAWQDRHAWIQATAIAGIVLLPVINIAVYRFLERLPTETEAPYTDCRKCGYNLTGTLGAGGTKCPECGEPVTEYQRIQSRIDQKKFGERPYV